MEGRSQPSDCPPFHGRPAAFPLERSSRALLARRRRSAPPHGTPILKPTAGARPAAGAGGLGDAVPQFHSPMILNHLTAPHSSRVRPSTSLSVSSSLERHTRGPEFVRRGSAQLFLRRNSFLRRNFPRRKRSTQYGPVRLSHISPLAPHGVLWGTACSGDHRVLVEPPGSLMTYNQLDSNHPNPRVGSANEGI